MACVLRHLVQSVFGKTDGHIVHVDKGAVDLYEFFLASVRVLKFLFFFILPRRKIFLAHIDSLIIDSQFLVLIIYHFVKKYRYVYMYIFFVPEKFGGTRQSIP